MKITVTAAGLQDRQRDRLGQQLAQIKVMLLWHTVDGKGKRRTELLVRHNALCQQRTCAQRR